MPIRRAGGAGGGDGEDDTGVGYIVPGRCRYLPDTTTHLPEFPPVSRMTDVHREAAKPAIVQLCPSCAVNAPFARAEIGDVIYEVAEMIDAADRLAFRQLGAEDWMSLSRTLEDGWSRICADILNTDPENLRHFLTTHAVRTRGWYRNGESIVFDTLGVIWAVRRINDRRAEVIFDGVGPRSADPSVATHADLREQAIEVLIAAFPDLRQRFATAVDQWAVRLASGARVTPVL